MTDLRQRKIVIAQRPRNNAASVIAAMLENNNKFNVHNIVPINYIEYNALVLRNNK